MENKSLIDLLTPLQLEHHQLYCKTLNLINKSMEEKEKYYIPDREDIRVGYTITFDSQGVSYEFTIQDTDDYERVINRLFKSEENIYNYRTPFLTKEQIIAEGWEETEHRTYRKKTKRGILIFTDCGIGNGFFSDISREAELSNPKCLFSGQIRCINDFRTICKLLNIK